MRVCSVDGCNRKHFVHGLCNMHHLRQRRYGSLDLPERDPTERFWPKVEKRGPDECWLWLAGRADGYGMFRLDSQTPIRAHRFAYQTVIGPIPAGFTIDHLCRNPLCVNPAHMEAVTRSENIRRENRDRIRVRKR